MFCPHCGSPIPDGTKFCTECGTPVAAPDVPETSAASAPADSSPANGFGYSVVGGGASGSSHAAAPRPPVSPEIESKPLVKRWWFWVIIGLLAVVLVIVIAAAVLSARTYTAVPPASTTNSLRPNLAEHVNISDTGDNAMTLDDCVGAIDRELTDAGLGHAIEVDEDDWVFIDIWYDGIDDLAGAAYDGDADALAEWMNTLNDLCDLSESYRAFFDESGQPQAVSFVSILDEADTDILLSIAVDGELVFDFVTGVDSLGALEE